MVGGSADAGTAAPTEDDGMGTIVAGTDGSEHARDALVWAVDEARRRGSELLVVHAWETPITAYPGPLMGARAVDIEASIEAFHETADKQADEMRTWLHANAAGVTAHVSVLEGAAATRLLEASADADLLVLGSRGHGGFSTLLLGSVSDQCVRRSVCTVVIVPSGERAARA